MERVDIDQLSRLLEGKALGTIDGKGWGAASELHLMDGTVVSLIPCDQSHVVAFGEWGWGGMDLRGAVIDKVALEQTQNHDFDAVLGGHVSTTVVSIFHRGNEVLTGVCRALVEDGEPGDATVDVEVVSARGEAIYRAEVVREDSPW